MMALRLAIALLLALSGTQAWAEKRVALVIGNSAYRYAVPLSNPKNDAVDMAAKLVGLGFEVVSGEDLDLSAMRGAVRDFIGKLDGAEMALLFYAGHGVQVNGTNYMAPVDARLSSYNDLDFEAMPMDLVLSAMERTTKVNLVFLDACRDSPFSQNLSRSMGTRSGSVGRGLARLGTGVGTLISFATQPGNVALDGEGRNSPFSTALLKHLGTPGQDITRDLVSVRREVLEATDGKQVPWDNSSLTGEVILFPAAKAKSGSKDPPDSAKSVQPVGREMELAFWETIKDADVKDMFEAYLRQFPDGSFAELARVKIGLIESQAAREEMALATGKKEVDRGAATEGVGTSNELKIAAVPTEAAGPLGSEDAMIDPKQDRDLVRSVQNELNRLGCSVGQPDGVWGNRARRGLENYAKHDRSELASLDPSTDLLNLLKQKRNRICPLECQSGYTAKNGKCEKDQIKSPALNKKQAPSPKKDTVQTKSATQSNCPANAYNERGRVFPQTKGLYTGVKRIAARHPCGRMLVCTRPHSGTSRWSCGWQ